MAFRIVRHGAGMTEHERQITRRRLIELGLALPPLGLLASQADLLSSPALAATPAVMDADDDPTPELTEGPYFTPNSPKRRSIVPAGAAGTRLTLSGRVLTTAGRPIRNALIDFWQASARGVYDNSGYRFRGHQFTNAKGQYVLYTVVPGIYPGRTKHIHVKVQAPNEPVLTTQLFFPGVAGNRTDSIYDLDCVVKRWRLVNGRRLATFDFVLDV
jgi:protocatechuate 3,4-dioxygenase beta subunit